MLLHLVRATELFENLMKPTDFPRENSVPAGMSGTLTVVPDPLHLRICLPRDGGVVSGLSYGGCVLPWELVGSEHLPGTSQ